VVTQAAYDIATRQHYVPARPPRFLKTKVEGIGNEVALAVWKRGDG